MVRLLLKGLAAGGRIQEEKLVELSGLKLCSSEGDLSLPKLHAIVTDFEQEHMDPAHDPVEAGRLRLWAPGKNEKDKRETSDDGATPLKQPFIGIIDCGSSFSAVNWAAAELLDLPPKTKRFAYPTLDETGRVLEFAKPPAEWNPWTPVTVGIGDLPIFDLVLGGEKTKVEGPAAIIGMDVLSQRRGCRIRNL
eukprot:scaffold13014_cov57-Attheya_sp.AAC.2